ncbi:MAG: polysulfide reductase NrfD [Vicinamibacterales bacterium]|jgi:formate-dependent nitrite reductase membrane component NrfD|nr:polysulfide reductase NrfD [Vicinamibacterales bacterium]
MTPELFITRHNHLIDPFLHVWSWQIPVYLFLGGWVAGNMILTGYFMLGGRHTRRSPLLSALPGLSLVLLSLGMLALFLDLEHKRYVWRLYTTFQWASPMSWGSWILLLVYPVLLLTWMVRPPVILEDLSQGVERITTTLQGRRDIVRTIGITSMVLGVALGVYTGVLLSSLVARPLWNSGILGVLFVASGVSAAAAFGHLVTHSPDERALTVRIDNVVLASELGILGLFVLGLLAGSAQQVEAARLLLGGPFTALFWVFVVGLGIVIPLIIQLLAVRHWIQHTPIAPIMVMAGGLALRWVLVLAGQVSRWEPGTLRIH